MPTSPPTISALPTAPDPLDRASFNSRAYSWSAALPTFGNQIGAVAANVYTNAAEAAAAAASAAASAQSAVLSPGTSATSTTNLTISAGSKTLTIQTGKQFAVGQFVLIAAAAAPQNYMQAQITSHDSGTGQLVVSVSNTGGSGTFPSWVVSLSVPGAFMRSAATEYGSGSGNLNDAPVGSFSAYWSGTVAGANYPATSLSVAWWNVLTFGNTGRVTQIAQQAFATRTGQFWFRHQHDSTWHGWYRLPFTTAETGYLVSDGGDLGYGPGSGGTATQPTSKSAPVTLNKPCGMITTHAQSLAPGQYAHFSLHNSGISPTDMVMVCLSYSAGAGLNYRVFATTGLTGNAVISLQNTAGAALAEVIEIHFVVIKKVNT